MCARKSTTSRRPRKRKPVETALRRLTLDDLQEWAGAKILGRARGYVKKVSGLSATADGGIAAWVSGSERYATSVRILNGNRLEHACSCPYDWGGPCKHAVAVVLAAAEAEAEALKGGKAIAPLAEDSDLDRALSGDLEDAWDEGDEWDHEEDEWDMPQIPTRRGADRKATVEKALAGQSREALFRLLCDLAACHPHIERHILETKQLADGRTDQLIRVLRKDIARLTAEPAWYDPWRGEGSIPDYGPVAERLRALLDHGHADAVVELGETLWGQGNAQVEQSDDEGETGIRLAACLDVVLEALPRSSLAPPAQLLWLIDRLFEDDFDLLGGADAVLRKRIYTRAHWREVAGVLEARLDAMPRPKGGGFRVRYSRERVLRALLDAYPRAGWKDRIIPRLETEAGSCACYEPLVDALLVAGERDRARQWCIEGYRQTVKEAPGIAAHLQERLRAMAQRSRRHDLAAAYRAQDFFSYPSRKAYQDLHKAAGKAGCWPAVREAVLGYLETGKPPADKAWPLPAPEVGSLLPERRSGRWSPDLATLIDIAILEQRFDDVVALYERLGKTLRWGREVDKRVAEVVAASHPRVALDIWRTIAEELIKQVKPKAYEEAAVYLRKMRKVHASEKSLDDWRSLLDGLRGRHKAKRRMMEVLDTVEGKGIAG